MATLHTTHYTMLTLHNDTQYSDCSYLHQQTHQPWVSGVNETIGTFQCPHGVAESLYFLKVVDIFVQDVHDGGGVTNVEMVHKNHVHCVYIGGGLLLRMFGPIATPRTVANCVARGWICNTGFVPTSSRIQRYYATQWCVRSHTREPATLRRLRRIPPHGQRIGDSVVGEHVIILQRGSMKQSCQLSHKMDPGHFRMDHGISSQRGCLCDGGVSSEKRRRGSPLGSGLCCALG